MEDAAIGIDVGGTKIACGLVNRCGVVLRGLREEIENRGGDGLGPAEQIAAAIRSLSADASRQGYKVSACGVAVPAVLERESGRVIWAPNIPGWRDFPLGGMLGARTGLGICLDHDGPAAILGEQWVGAARGAADAVLLIVGTGIGAGYILGGRVQRGARGAAGGVGWWCLEAGAAGEASYRDRGFLETVAAGAGIARAYRRQAGLDDDAGTTAREVFALAAGGDEIARRVLARTCRYLGLAVANLVSALGPEVVVLGGGVGRNLGPYLDRIAEVVGTTAQPQAAAGARLVTAALGDEAGVIGAARFALEELGVAVM